MKGLKIEMFFILIILIFPKCLAKKVQCPSFQNICNFDDPNEVKELQDKIMDDIWNIPNPSLTELGDDFVEILDDLVDGRIPLFRRYALATSEWIWAYLPDVDEEINLCPYAKIINATIEFNEKHDCNKLMEAVNETCKAFTEAGFMLTTSGLKNAGCSTKGFKKVEPSGQVCYKNGFIYDIEKMWDKIGWDFPCKLRHIVTKLYHSIDVTDNLMALMATAVLSDYLAILEREYDSEILYKLFVMLTPGKIPPCCCNLFINEAKELSGLIQSRNAEIFKKARDYTRCKY